MPYKQNQYAPQGFQGLASPRTSDGSAGTRSAQEPKPYSYIYAPPNGQLTANQLINPDSVAIQTDADFLLFGLWIPFANGLFQIQLIDATGYQLSSGLINSGGLSAVSSRPTVISPSHPFPAGGKIQIVIQDLSGATNEIQIAFVGKKVYRMVRN